jgi:hypothetical protein
MPSPTAFLLRSHFRSSFDSVASTPSPCCRFFAAFAMFGAGLQFAVIRLEAEVAGLRRQLDDLASETRGLRQAALDDAAADAGARRELHRQHRVALAAARVKAKADVAEEMAAAVAAARVEATVAEQDRIRSSVGPVLAAMQAEQERLKREVAAAAVQREALESELADTRRLVWDVLADPTELLARMGM